MELRAEETFLFPVLLGLEVEGGPLVSRVSNGGQDSP